jgi:hypothetical protein
MPKHLTDEQLEAYRRDGAVSPVPLLSRKEAAFYRRKFDELEESIGDEPQTRYRIKAHLPFPWLTELIHHPALLDAIEDVMGPNLLVWGTSFFTKAARDPRFISWHQDSTYYGLEPPESVTAWIAFSDSTEHSGCMRFIPGSHLGPHILPHVETDEPNNLLSRGQTILDIDESIAKSLPARAGEFSIHHNKTTHSSEPNKSDDARIGFTAHFATPEIRQAQFDGATATLVRGEDNVGNWLPDPVAQRDFDPDCLDALDEAWVRYRTAMRAQV